MCENSEIRKLFPAIAENNGIIYFDNAASTQKPEIVLQKVAEYNRSGHANIHRGAYHWSVEATATYEMTRRKTAEFINAESPEQIVFTRGTTESINLIASSYGRSQIKEGDRIVVSLLEHHSNFVPWQQLALEKKAYLDFLNIDPAGNLIESEWDRVITPGVKLVAITMMSNVLGITTPIDKIIEKAHAVGAVVVVDAAQAIQHQKIDVRALDADFLAFSAHKCFGLTGTGVLYGKKELLESMPPYQFGGDMIEYVTKEKTTFAPLPEKFEAGTANIDGVIALSAAIDFIEEIGWGKIREIEQDLTGYAIQKMKMTDHVIIYGNPASMYEKGPVISFNIEGVHPHDVSSILDNVGIAVRSGHHCAQPLMKELAIQSAVRASFSIYNTKAEIDYFAEKLKEVRRWLGYGS
ncbi:SufS family cysteine desulfurase [Clostridiales bacterium COT073_COT-073]|nr:SufS family cysteine desulfurase [Clostridiales bacterium COT073_COT-073]